MAFKVYSTSCVDEILPFAGNAYGRGVTRGHLGQTFASYHPQMATVTLTGATGAGRLPSAASGSCPGLLAAGSRRPLRRTLPDEATSSTARRCSAATASDVSPTRSSPTPEDPVRPVGRPCARSQASPVTIYPAAQLLDDLVAAAPPQPPGGWRSQTLRASCRTVVSSRGDARRRPAAAAFVMMSILLKRLPSTVPEEDRALAHPRRDRRLPTVPADHATAPPRSNSATPTSRRPRHEATSTSRPKAADLSPRSPAIILARPLVEDPSRTMIVRGYPLARPAQAPTRWPFRRPRGTRGTQPG